MKTIDGLRPAKISNQPPKPTTKHISVTFGGKSSNTTSVNRVSNQQPLNRNPSVQPKVNQINQPSDSINRNLREDSIRTAPRESSYNEMLKKFSDSKNMNYKNINHDNYDPFTDEKKPKRPTQSSPEPKNIEPEEPLGKPIFTKKPHFLKPRRIIFLLIFGIIAFVVFNFGDGLIKKITNGKSGLFEAVQTFTSEKTVPLATDSKGRTNILIFGTSGYDMDGKTGSGVHDGAALTDSIMFVSIDQKTGNAAMLNIPRDLKVDNTCTSTGKINEVYWCSNTQGKNEAAGADSLKFAIEKITGQKIHYYAHINWGALVKTVDMLGGITVTLDETINDYGYTKTHIKKGVPTHLNGEQALGLARARHGSESGDFSRGNSQQKILIALQKRVIEQGLDFTKIMNIVNIVGDNVRTDFKIEEIKTLVKIGKNFDVSNVQQIAIYDPTDPEKYIKTAMINGISYVIPTAGVGNYKQIQQLIKDVISGNVAEKAKIAVLNGSEVSGAAARERVRLESAEFEVGTVGDAKGNYEEKEYYVYQINDKVPKTAEKLKNFYKTDLISKDKLDKSILAKYAEYDFVIIIGGK